jgi:hypothetical protein
MFRPYLVASLAYCLPAMLTCLIGQSSGAELVVRDAQIITTLEPAGYDFSLSSASGSSSGRDGFATAGGFEIGGRYSFARPGDAFGLVSGIDVKLRNAEGSNSHLRSLLAHGSAGLGWAITDRWLITLEGGAGYGYSDFYTTSTTTHPSFTNRGTIFMIDGRLTAGYLMNDNWRVLGVLGYGQATNDFHQDRVDLTLTQTGPSIGLGISYVFSRAPTLVK